MKYLLDKQSLEKLAVEVFGPDRVWVDHSPYTVVVPNPEFDEDEYNEDPENYDVPEGIEREVGAIKIYIHFPQVVVENSEGLRHTIYDLYTRFNVYDIDPDGAFKCRIGFTGARATYTIKEMQKGYTHSHLPTGYYKFKGFCTGASTYNTILSDVKMNPTEEMWLLLFLGLDRYVSWESIEGGPYELIGNLSNPNENVADSSLENELKRLIPYLPKEVWTYNEGLELIEKHPSLYQVFNRYSSIRTKNTLSKEKLQVLVTRYTNVLLNNGEPIIWKGKEIQKKILVDMVDDMDTHISGEVVEQYINYLKNYANAFNKQIGYEQAKQLWHSIAFDKVGTIE